MLSGLDEAKGNSVRGGDEGEDALSCTLRQWRKAGGLLEAIPSDLLLFRCKLQTKSEKLQEDETGQEEGKGEANSIEGSEHLSIAVAGVAEDDTECSGLSNWRFQVE